MENDVFYFTTYTGGFYSYSNSITKYLVHNKPYRFSGFTIHPTQRNLIVAIIEDYTIDKPADVVIDINTKDEDSRLTTLVRGADLYMNPRLSPEGDYLSWHQ